MVKLILVSVASGFVLTVISNFVVRGQCDMGMAESNWVPCGGWPKLMGWWGVGLMPREDIVSTIGGTFFFNLFSLTMLSGGLVPNLVFWSVTSIMVLFGAMRALKK